ncbi:myb-related transcription factor, partner of profilin-like [Ambystoma mexicanum]|uniref:myb-related transcription factor, partner of profilin-like n=1 Tax=Ambystoma mexicanum TaxID=8296 RepID=UPI0037E7FFB1
MAARIPAQRQRKQRFSEAELTVLVDHIVQHAEMLLSADQRRATQQRRKEVWAETARKCTAVGVATRSVKDCHKRWDDLRLRVRNLIAALWHRSSGTGGGLASPLRLQTWEERCSSVLHLEAIHGIGDAEAGVSPPVDAAISSDNAQQARQRAPACGEPSTPAQEDEASCSGTQPPAASGTDAPANTTIPMLPTATQLPGPPILLTDPIPENLCTVEEAAGSDNSDPALQADVGPQGEEPNLDDIPSLQDLQFSCPPLHCPMMSPTPSMAELNARMQRMEDQQATLTQLVERQLEESRLQREEAMLQRESYTTSVCRMSRAIGWFATTIVTFARHVREGNNNTSTIAESMLIAQCGIRRCGVLRNYTSGCKIRCSRFEAGVAESWMLLLAR